MNISRRMKLCRVFFVAGNTAVLYGASNSGKTFLSLEIARAVSSGDNFLGLRTDKGDVLYIAAESPASIRTRIQAINKATGKKSVWYTRCAGACKPIFKS